MSETTKNLDAALLKAQQGIVSVDKDAKNDFHRYKYATAESMMAECRAVLHANGLLVTADGNGTLATISHTVALPCHKDELPVMADTNTVIVRRCFRLAHPESGESRVYNTEFPAVPEKGRPIDKAVAGALTSSLSYFLRDLLQVPRGDENEMDRRQSSLDEIDEAAKTTKARQKEAPPKANQTPQDEARAELKAWGIKVESLSAALLQVVKCHGHESVAKVPDSQWPMIITTIKDGRQSNEKFEDHFPPSEPVKPAAKAKPTPLQVVNALAQKWCDGDIKLAKDALKEAFSAACPDYKSGTVPTNDQYELVANYLDGLIAAKEWGKCDKAASNRLFEIAKMGALPLHDGQQLTKQDLDEIIAYMKANPFEEVPK